jgi:hypothetical protein
MTDRVLFYPLFITVRERKGFPRAFMDAWFDYIKWALNTHMVFWTGVYPGSFEKSRKIERSPSHSSICAKISE